MFGATKFDPKSDLWIRIALFQGAPLFTELNTSFGEWNSLNSFDKDLKNETFSFH